MHFIIGAPSHPSMHDGIDNHHRTQYGRLDSGGLAAQAAAVELYARQQKMKEGYAVMLRQYLENGEMRASE